MAVLVIWLDGAKAFDSIASIAAATRRMAAKKREENMVDFAKRGAGRFGIVAVVICEALAF